MITKNYVAGFIDADGCIGVKRRKPTLANREKSIVYRPYLTITNTNRKILEEIRKFFKCGSISTLTRVKPHWKVGYTYEICGNQNLFPVLEKLIKYLIVKKNRAEKILQYKAYFTNAYGRGNQYSGKQTLPKNVFYKRKELYNWCKNTNKKGV